MSNIIVDKITFVVVFWGFGWILMARFIISCLILLVFVLFYLTFGFYKISPFGAFLRILIGFDVTDEEVPTV